MAHFAKLDENNNVIDVVVVKNNVLWNENEVEQEQLGKDFLTNLFPNTVWVQASYNGSFRKQYPLNGSTYDPIKDIFIIPQPFPSWSLDENNDWSAPIPKPTDSDKYDWHEESQSWISSDAFHNLVNGEPQDEFID